MRDFAVGAIAALIFFGILYLPIEGEMKNLLAGVACLAIICFYVGKAMLVKGQINWRKVSVIVLPTFVLMVVLVFNLMYQLGIGWLYLWGGYAVFTAIALNISSRIGWDR